MDPAAAAASVVAAEPAAADNGQAVVLGKPDNIATSPTGLPFVGTTQAFGFGVTDNGISAYEGKSAVVGHAKGQAFTTAVHGMASGTATGVKAFAIDGTGVDATSFTGMAVRAEGDVAVRAISAAAALIIEPRTSAGNQATAETGTIRSQIVTGGATLWYCLQGSSGVSQFARWRKLIGPGTAGASHLLPVPVRVYDSRPGTAPSQGPKTPLPAGNVARTIDLTVNASTVPTSATGVLLTVLLVNASAGGGNLTVWANLNPKPAANTMVWGGSAGRFTTMALTAVDPAARVRVDASLQTDVVIDVVGYYQ